MGPVVVVEIVQRPRRRESPVGKIVEILGEHMAPGMEIEMALRTYDIPNEWPGAVDRYVKKFGDEVPDDAKEGRIDLRDLPLVTIDGEDARDFDDAVFCEPLEDGGWQHGYHLLRKIHRVAPILRFSVKGSTQLHVAADISNRHP